MKKIIFTLAEARSGTLYLRNLFRLNARDCDCRHETFFDIGNPTMFGPAIYDAYAGRFGNIRARLEKKRRYIQKLPGSTYIESSHSFLKSSRVAALDFFPDLQLVHLIRDPLKVAASEAYRELWRRRLHAPFHFYRGDDGKRHFVWALTGNEAIFQHFAAEPLSLFQWYLIQWVEIENRAMDFLDANGLHDRCFTLHSPHDLNDAAKIRELFGFLGVPAKQPEILFGGRKNKSIGYFMAPGQRDNEVRFVLERLPDQYLQIFRKKPYCDLHWASALNKAAGRDVNCPSEPENCRLPGRLSQLTC
jgi:hypothetical protein